MKELSKFEMKVMEDFNTDPSSSSFLIEGYLDGELRQRLASRDLEHRRYEFDGYKLDTIKLAANIKTQKDISDLVAFLQITRYCLPKQ